jgi:hypothetical protein
LGLWRKGKGTGEERDVLVSRRINISPPLRPEFLNIGPEDGGVAMKCVVTIHNICPLFHKQCFGAIWTAATGKDCVVYRDAAVD